MTKESPPLRVVFVGHVDHGKSTLVGRILHDTDSLPEGKIEMVKKACAEEGMEFEFAFVLDALLEEQKQNVRSIRPRSDSRHNGANTSLSTRRVTKNSSRT